MKIIKMDPENPDDDLIHEVIDVLSSGGVVLYPTDTIYGLGANIFNNDAVERIYDIKNRDTLKPLSVAVSSIKGLLLIAELRTEHVNLLSSNLPGPFTFLFYKTSVVDSFMANFKKIGVRIPKSKIAIELSQIFPITATSANLSTKETLKTPKEILKQLNCDVDLAIDVGPLDSNQPSTVVDLTKKDLVIKRQGIGTLL